MHHLKAELSLVLSTFQEVITKSHAQPHVGAARAETHIYTQYKVLIIKQCYRVLWPWILMSD